MGVNGCYRQGLERGLRRRLLWLGAFRMTCLWLTGCRAFTVGRVHTRWLQQRSFYRTRRQATTTEMTNDCRQMVDAAIAAVDPYLAVSQSLLLSNNNETLQIRQKNGNGTNSVVHTFVLSDYSSVRVVSFGKAAVPMARAVVDCLDNTKNYLSGGLVVTKTNHSTRDDRQYLQQHNITTHEASHPVPDQGGVDASEKVLHLLESTRVEKSSLVLCCISGGGSALFCTPRPPLTLQDLQTTNTLLLQSGWTIQQMNVIRQQLEVAKGGGLLTYNPHAQVVGLILSDIVGDPLPFIASGPTVPPPSTTPNEAWNLYQSQWPTHVSPLSDSVLETLRKPKPHNAHPTPVNVLVGNSKTAVDAAAARAKQLGYEVQVLEDQQGEALEVAMSLVQRSRQLQWSNRAKRPCAVIAGGETTVTLNDSHGLGGRNQELALAAALQLHQQELRNIVIGSVGTDGTDGPTDAAGAIVDCGTIKRLPGNAVQALEKHNAYPYLQQVDDAGHSPLVKVRNNSAPHPSQCPQTDGTNWYKCGRHYDRLD